ncbi:ferredoxin [Algirhabdus cladophorae]|uniref:ferredoxin n=1 Tax=Algirhabdus cladophorae TaxID=3377108 RepID=UPI003B84A534
MKYDDLQQAAAALDLEVSGGFHPTGEDGCPPDTQTLILLSPREPDFWGRVTAQPEFREDAKDPLDRWSQRVISQLALATGATALFPFSGPPYQPFIAWAKRSGRAWASPVGILVHDQAGLFASYRGALALPYHVELPALPACPCDTCAGQPCLNACPVDAMGAHPYDVPICKDYLRQPDQTCITQGCAVRRICPVSQSYGRNPDQSGYHMKVFLG